PAITQIARHGHIGRGIPACDSCHGIGLTGPEETPVLNGQPRDYLEQQLTAFASGERDNDIYARMREIARLLTPDEIRQLAIYYSGKPATQYKPRPVRWPRQHSGPPGEEDGDHQRPPGPQLLERNGSRPDFPRA